MLSEHGILLGHHTYNNRIEVDHAKIKIIIDLPIPKKQKYARSFLGHASYQKIFTKYFSEIASPMFSLLTNDVEFQWIEDSQATFEEIKQKIISTHVLQGPKRKLPFHIHLDALETSIGVVLS